jgi:acetyltransferase-like isoleucine patch superfamily enzyme
MPRAVARLTSSDLLCHPSQALRILYTMRGHRLSHILKRLYDHVTLDGVRAILFGLIVRTRLQKAGFIIVPLSWTLPTIDNRGGRVEVGNCALFGGVRLEVWRDATITIGTGTYLNRNTEIVAARSVTIGRDCKIARDVLIMDSDQHERPGVELVIAPVVIEDRVWIGARAIILKGVHIGHDSVIAAGAIVTKSVPPRSVVVGTAARVIKTQPPTEDETETTVTTG